MAPWSSSTGYAAATGEDPGLPAAGPAGAGAGAGAAWRWRRAAPAAALAALLGAAALAAIGAGAGPLAGRSWPRAPAAVAPQGLPAVGLDQKAGAPRFTNKPRVRREWRTLSDAMRRRVAAAFWTLKRTSRKEGRAKYGPHFQNYDEMLMLHACAVLDPRCDQGHAGPHFMTFHRLLLLKVELALLAVDPGIGALPYWDMGKDAVDGAYRNDPDKYIFTDKYFGSFFGQGSNYEVDDGMFANWPIAEYSSSTFGPDSPLAEESRCAKMGWFTGTEADTCTECCGQDDCECPKGSANKTYMRGHADCTPHLARQPNDTSSINRDRLGGTYELVFDDEDFVACHTVPENVRSWMEWHNCQDPGFFFCSGDPKALANRPKFVAALKDQVLPQVLEKMQHMYDPDKNLPDGQEKLGFARGVAGIVSATLFNANKSNVLATIQALCSSPMVYGIYSGLHSDKKSFPHFHHGNAHFKLGRDMFDVTTSPNDPGAFSGHHSNIDRSNMHYTMNSFMLDPKVADSFWRFPKTQSDLTGSTSPPYGAGGPFSLNGLSTCEDDKDTFTFYRFSASPWVPGTLLDDVANAGYPFVDLFNSSCAMSNVGPAMRDQNCSGRGHGGYTHREVIYYTSPERTPYTYDTLEHFYY